MEFQIIITHAGTPIVFSKDKVDEYIEKSRGSCDVQFTGYVYDEEGNFVGIKGLGDQGAGYGFHDKWQEFVVTPGKTFSFTHTETDIDGPTDWSDRFYKVTVKLEMLEEQA